MVACQDLTFELPLKKDTRASHHRCLERTMVHLGSSYEEGFKRAVRSALSNASDTALPPPPRPQLLMAGDNSSSNSCVLLVDESNLTDGKIPQVMGIALGAWLVCAIVFLVIRYMATDYSRAGLATSCQYVEQSKMSAERKERSLSLSTMLYEDKHWYTWFINFFYRVRASDIRNRCGPDAILYLSLHSYLIVLLCVLTCLSLLIILPVNYFAGHIVTTGGFPRTTISNLDPSSSALWTHTIMSLVYLIITALFMIHYSLQLGKYQQLNSNRSVMVQWIPTMVHREDILQHLGEAIPDSPIADVQMAYDVKHLTALHKQRAKVAEEIDVAKSIRDELRKGATVRVGWRKLFFWVESYKLDAHAYYEQRYRELVMEIERENQVVKERKKLGIGFITFRAEEDSKRFSDSYKLCSAKPKSSVYQDVNAGWWWVTSAPYPLDIIWENLSVSYLLWWIRWGFVNAVLVLIVFFFTTPSILVTSVDQLRLIFTDLTHIPDITQLNESYSDPLVKIIIPNILLLFFASLLPFCVAATSYLEAHWTKSFREQTIMRKTYIFLLLMVMILPSVGLASLNSVAVLVTEKHFNLDFVLKDRLKCVFLPNSGAFFVGYVITSGLIGAGISLLRIPDLLLYILRRVQAKTRLQKELALKKAADNEFRYGVQYAWNLVVFTMVISFSLTTPLIVPFGVVYFIFAYYTDRYNIYYVYKPAPFNGRQFLHRSAVNFVIVGAALLQLLTLFFSVIRLGNVDPRSVFMIVTFTLTCVVCICIMFFGWFKHFIAVLGRKIGKGYEIFGSPQGECGLEPLNYSEESDEEDTAKGAYIPPVLQKSPDGEPGSKDSSHSGMGYQSFGSTDRMGRRSATQTPSPALSSPTSTPQPQQSVPTLERRRSGAAIVGGGALGATGGEHDKPSKPFV